MNRWDNCSPVRPINDYIKTSQQISEELSQDFDTKVDLEDKPLVDEETKVGPVTTNYESSEYSLYANEANVINYDEATEEVKLHKASWQ